MKRKLMTVTIIASMIAASLTGCGSTGSTASTTTTTEAAATTETGASDTSSETAANDLNIMIETPVESLDPQIGQDGTSFEVIADFTDGLMADGTQKVRRYLPLLKAMSFRKMV